jgi:hypothetical protein
VNDHVSFRFVVNDPLSDLVKNQTCMIIYRHLLKCKFFCRFA